MNCFSTGQSGPRPRNLCQLPAFGVSCGKKDHSSTACWQRTFSFCLFLSFKSSQLFLIRFSQSWRGYQTQEDGPGSVFNGGTRLSAFLLLSLVTVSKLKGKGMMKFQEVKLIYTINSMLSCMKSTLCLTLWEETSDKTFLITKIITFNSTHGEMHWSSRKQKKRKLYSCF